MAGIDKQHEFYTCAKRFAFLASCYRPEDLPEEVNSALDIFSSFVDHHIDFRVMADEAEEWFDNANEQLEMIRRKDLLSSLIKECCR